MKQNASSPALRGVLGTIGAMGAFAILHSLLATEHSKALVARAIGSERRDAFYRLGYNGVAALTTAGLLLTLHRLPDRELYRLRGVARVPLEAGRAFFVLCIVEAAREMGFAPLSGFGEIRAYFTHGGHWPAPEAQGPPQPGGHIAATGVYRFTRHPLNFSAAAIPFLMPRMTAVRLTAALATLGYALIGSRMEEKRLLRRYPEEYGSYQRSGVPFFLPSVSHIVRQLRARD